MINKYIILHGLNYVQYTESWVESLVIFIKWKTSYAERA